MNYNRQAEELLEKLAAVHANSVDPFEHFQQFSKGEAFVLFHLMSQNTAVSPTSISKAMSISTARITAVLGNLESKGLIAREINRKDRRKIFVSITEEGKKLTSQKRSGLIMHLGKIFEQMGEDDTKTFIHTFSRFLEISSAKCPNT